MKKIFGFVFLSIVLTSVSWAGEVKSVQVRRLQNQIHYGHEDVGFYAVCENSAGTTFKTLEESTQSFLVRNFADGNMRIIKQGADELGFDSLSDEYSFFILKNTSENSSNPCWFEISAVEYKGGTMFFKGR